MDKFSYAIGLGIGQNLLSMGAQSINVEDFAQAIKDVLDRKETAISHNEAREIVNKYFEELETKLNAENIEKGKSFLKENAKRPGVVTLPSGLQYEVITEGNGKKPSATDRVKCHYEGTLIDGTLFDSSIKRGEPAIFGVNLRFGKPFVMGCIGGAAGALFASITGLGATGTGVTGIFGILLCLNNPVAYILMFVIAFGVAFVLTWMFGYKDAAQAGQNVKGEAGSSSDNNVSEKAESAKAVEASETATTTVAADGVSDTKSAGIPDLYSALTGTAIPLSQVNDATFASEVLGKGIAVIPEKGEVVAPCDATVETVFDTKHAVGMSTESGVELLIHIGINTVELGGKYYTTHVKDGDQVKKGQLLVSFDMDKIKEAGYDVTTPLIVTNSDDYRDVKILHEGMVTPEDKVLEIMKE